jgi:hypothetical protein
VEKWISDGMFTPVRTPSNGKARGWTKQDALRLACLVRLVDAGLKVEVGKAINRLSAFEISESEFLVVLAYKKAIWKSESQKDGSSKPVNTGEHYDALVTNKKEITAQLEARSWLSLINILVNLNDVRNDVDRAWSYATSQRKNPE